MSGMGKSLVQHGPNTYCVLGTVEEEKVTGDLVPAFGSSGPWGGWYANNAVTNALGHCIPGALGALPTHPPSQWELGALGGNGGEGLRGQAWGPGHPWELHHPQAHKGWRVDLWSPWGRSDTLWTQGAALNSLSPHNSVYQPGQQDGFTSWLSCQICSWPSSFPHCPPGSARPGDGVCSSLRVPLLPLLRGSSCLLTTKPGQQAVCLCCQGCFRMGFVLASVFLC